MFQNFPVTDLAGLQILSALPAVISRAKEHRWEDVVANAQALDRNLRAVEKHWMKRKEDESIEETKSIAATISADGPSETEKVGIVDETDIGASPEIDINMNQDKKSPKNLETAARVTTRASSLTSSVPIETAVLDHSSQDEDGVIVCQPETLEVVDVDDSIMQQPGPLESKKPLESHGIKRLSDVDQPPSKRQKTSSDTVSHEEFRTNMLSDSPSDLKRSAQQHLLSSSSLQPIIIIPPPRLIESSESSRASPTIRSTRPVETSEERQFNTREESERSSISPTTLRAGGKSH